MGLVGMLVVSEYYTLIYTNKHVERGIMLHAWKS